MADIRQSPTGLDDFTRANENPLSHGGDWQRVAPSSPSVWGLLKLVSNHVEIDNPLSIGFAYWNPLTLDGDDQECWARGTGGNAPGIGWRVGLIKDVTGASTIVDGYLARFDVSSGGGSVNLRKYTNGSFTTIASTSSSPPTGNPGYLLIRRSGNNIQVWANSVAGNPANWTKYLDVADTTYMTGLKPVIGLSDNSSSQLVGFGPFGAGPVDFIPQIILRPRGSDT